MKRSRFAASVGTCIAIIALAGFVRTAAQRPSVIDGVWDYAVPGLRGQAFFQGGHYVFFFTQADSTPAAGALSEAAQAKVYRMLTLEAGTYSISDTIVTMQPVQGKDPRQAPGAWRWSIVSMMGDTLTFHFPLNAQGQARNTGRSVRVRPRS